MTNRNDSSIREQLLKTGNLRQRPFSALMAEMNPGKTARKKAAKKAGKATV